MGITIHMEGKLASDRKFDELMAFTVAFADEYALKYELFLDIDNQMIKVKNGKIIEDTYPVKGIVFQPAEHTEPFRMEFDEDLHCQTFCKTQFDTPEAHIFLIGYLKKIESFFAEFQVIDEGEYWEFGDRTILYEKMNFISQMINQIKTSFEQEQNNNWKYN